MQTVTLKVNGQMYRVACDPGQEDALLALGEQLDHRMRVMSTQLQGGERETLWLMLCLQLLDQLQHVQSVQFEENEVLGELEAIATRLEHMAGAAGGTA